MDVSILDDYIRYCCSNDVAAAAAAAVGAVVDYYYYYDYSSHYSMNARAVEIVDHWDTILVPYAV